MKLKQFLLITVLMLCWGALAQLSPEARQVLDNATRLADEARQQYAGRQFTVDQPLWREALREGEKALALSPDAPEPLRFLAESYRAMQWHNRAWEAWLAYRKVGGDMDAAALAGLSEAGNELGYYRYTARELEQAIHFYQQVYTLNPADKEAIIWLGRIYYEQGLPKSALPYWKEAVRRGLGEGSEYYLERVQHQVSVGISASDAFFEGITAYEAKQFEEALSKFTEAASNNPDFKDAWVWAGRTSFDLKRPQEAQHYWQRVVNLDPEDRRATYFLKVTEQQLRWGVEPVLAFEAGLAKYEAGEPREALKDFERAANMHPEYKDAMAWVARIHQELAEPELALPYWERVLALDPTDERAVYFVNVTETQTIYGIEAANAFEEGIVYYQVALFPEAQDAFERAAEENPDYAEAWAWLGRVYFEKADYPPAAEAYGKAAELEPDNTAYNFFAKEAARLAESSVPSDDAEN